MKEKEEERGKRFSGVDVRKMSSRGKYKCSVEENKRSLDRWLQVKAESALRVRSRQGG